MIRECDKTRVINILRTYVDAIRYPLSYECDRSFYHGNKNFNCYAYALGLRRLDNFKSLLNNKLSIYNPGTISSFETILYDEEKLIKAFLEDCYILGLECKPTNLNSNVSSNSSKIAIYIEPEEEPVRDFHFARLNNNGIWSNMKCSGGSVFMLGEDNIEDIPGYNFLGTYALRKKR